MEEKRLFKIAEERFVEFSDKAGLLQSRMEDLHFRAIRISNALKNKQKSRDALFGEDLALMRRAVRTFSQECSSLPGLMDWLEREAHYDPELAGSARALLSIVSTLQKSMTAFCEQSRMLHQYVHDSDMKMEAWYMVQDIETLAQKMQVYPFIISGRIMGKLTTPDFPAPGA